MFRLDGIKQFFSNNRLIAFLFSLSTFFYLLQHASGFSWDFSSYVLNARYFAGGSYFEWFRPPLAPFLIFIFSFAGWAATEYIYIIAVSVLHLFSALKFSEAYNIDKKLFYTFSLTAFTYVFAFNAGTELLSLALLQLFLSYLKSPKAGVFLALAALARYPNAIYLPLMLVQERKKTVLSIALFVLTFSPWLLYNYLYSGDALTSIGDSYAINFLFRRGVYETPLNIFDIIVALNTLLPLFAIGLAKRIKNIGENEIILLLLAALTLLSFVTVPLKYTRFLFPLIIPAAYFASFVFTRSIAATAFALISIILLFLSMPSAMLENPFIYQRLASDKCAAQSNAWVPLNYFGHVSEPFPYREALNDSVKDGYRVVLFKDIADPAYVANETLLHSFPIIEETNDYIILGNSTTCRNATEYHKTFLQRQNEYYARYKYPINLTPTKALLSYSIQ